MAFPPTNGTQVCVVPLATPFSTLTLYTVPATPAALFFSWEGVKTLITNHDVEISASAATTVHFWWPNAEATSIAWYSNLRDDTPSSQSFITREHIMLKPTTASISSEAPISSELVTTTDGQSNPTVTAAPTTPSSSRTVPTETGAPRGNHSVLSNGAVAGVAIGCLLAGAFIAGLVLWFCYGKRRGRHSRDSEVSAIALIPPEKGVISHTRSLREGISPRIGADAILPQPLEDQAIAGEMSKIGSLIKNHVQSFYHNKPVTPGLLDHDDLTALGRDLPISAGTLSTLLDNTATREVALRFCIAWTVVGRLQTYGSSSESLLPPELCAPMREILALNTNDKAHTLKAAHWRVTTAELMRSTYVQNPFTASDSRSVAILSLAQTLETILQPLADSRMNNQERKCNLEEILKRSALFAFTMFSQPSLWDFDWNENQAVKSGDLCIFPALVQVTNEAGQRVRPPRSFSEAVIRRLEV